MKRACDSRSRAFLILKATPEGLGLSDDSIAYIAGARSILAGQGYREAWLASNQPVTHFPPVFSSLLALIGLFDLDPLRGARFLNALLFGLNTFLLGILGWRMTKSLPAGLMLAALFVSNSSLLRVHGVAMSEPLFIFLSLFAFWMFDLFWERHAHWLWLFLCASFTGMAYLTRYAGLALIATFILALIVLHDNWQRRFKSASIFIVSVLPWLAGWAIRNRLVAENSTNRAFLWHPITADNISLGVRTFAGFLVPVETWKRGLSKIPGFFETAPGRCRHRHRALLRTARAAAATPRRQASGYRRYSDADVARLRFIRRAKDLGFTLQEIQDLLKLSAAGQGDRAEVRALAQQRLTDTERRLEELEVMRAALAGFVAHCSGTARSRAARSSKTCSTSFQNPDPPPTAPHQPTRERHSHEPLHPSHARRP